MAKKKATKKISSELFNKTFKEVPKDDGTQLIKHLNKLVEKFKVKPEEVIKVYKEKLDKIPEGRARRYGVALKSTRNAFKQGGRQSAKPVLGFIIGMEHRISDMDGDREKDLKAEYSAHKKDNTQDDIEIEVGEYNGIWDQFKKLKDTDEDSAREYIKGALDGRFVVIEVDKDGYVKEKVQYTENMLTWPSGKNNFNFGKIIFSNPAVPMYAVIVDDINKFVTINIKGADNLVKIREAPFYTPVTMNVVVNPDKGKKWWVDKTFSIEEVSGEDAFGTKEGLETIKKIIKLTKTTVPKENQVVIEKVDSWQRKLSKKKGYEYGIPALIKGSIASIYYTDEGTASIILDEESDDLDDMSIWDEDKKEVSFKVKCNNIMTSKIDFDVDTTIYVYGQIYRGNQWDSATKSVVADDDGKPIPAEMPTMNVWGFITDPELTNSIAQSATVDSTDYESDEEEDEEEEDDSFEIPEDDEE